MKRFLVLGVVGLVASLGACGGGSAGPQGAQGDPGEAGAPGEPGEAGPPGPGFDGAIPQSISGVTPPRAFLARNGQVTISGYGTTWSSATTVNFGANIKVTKTTVASPTALVVDITTDDTAALGPRDVTVKDGSNTETYKGAFDVLSPISATFQGTAAQGALFYMTLTVVDETIPLDTTSTVDFLGNVTYTNLAITLPSGFTNQGITAASPFSAHVLLSADVNTTPGTSDLKLVSGPPGVAASDVAFPLPKGLTVVARTATALTSGTAATGNTATPYDSALYGFTPTASPTILDWSAASTSTSVTPLVALLPSSGLFTELIGFGGTQTTVTTAATPNYAVYWDNTGATGPYSLTMTATVAAGSAAASVGDGASCAAGVVPAGLPFILTSGNLADTAGMDWVKVVMPAGKTSLRVQTAGDLNTDIQVELFASDGTTDVGGGPVETGSVIDNTFTGLTAGTTYCVQFAQGQFGFSSADATYTGIIRAL